MENKNLFKGKIHSDLSLERKVKITQEIVSELVRRGKSNNIGELYDKVFNDVDKSSFIIEYRLLSPLDLPLSLIDIYKDSKDFLILDNILYYISDYKGYIIISVIDEDKELFRLVNYTSKFMRNISGGMINVLSELILNSSDLEFKDLILKSLEYLNKVSEFKNNLKNLSSEYRMFTEDVLKNKTINEVFYDVESIAIKKRIYTKLSLNPKKYAKVIIRLNTKENNALETLYRYYMEFINKGEINSLELEHKDIEKTLNLLFKNLWIMEEKQDVEEN